MRRKLLTLLSAALLAGSLTACSGGEKVNEDDYIRGFKKITTVDPMDRVELPDFSGKDLEGNSIAKEDFAGKIVVINRWGSWCAPCVKEAPVLKAVSEELADDNVEFLGVLARDSAAAAQAFNKKHGIEYPTLTDEENQALLWFADSLPSQAIPTTWIIDKDGRVAVRIMDDKLSEATLKGAIEYVQKSTA